MLGTVQKGWGNGFQTKILLLPSDSKIQSSALHSPWKRSKGKLLRHGGDWGVRATSAQTALRGSKMKGHESWFKFFIFLFYRGCMFKKLKGKGRLLACTIHANERQWQFSSTVLKEQNCTFHNTHRKGKSVP